MYFVASVSIGIQFNSQLNPEVARETRPELRLR